MQAKQSQKKKTPHEELKKVQYSWTVWYESEHGK